MSRAGPVSCSACGERWPRHPVLEVDCPRCYAGVGTWCKRPSEHQAADLHVEREQRAVDLGKLRRCSEGPTARAARARAA